MCRVLFAICVSLSGAAALKIDPTQGPQPVAQRIDDDFRNMWAGGPQEQARSADDHARSFKSVATASAEVKDHMLARSVPFEAVTVTTADGYRLQMHRLPRPGAQPVVCIHGVLDSSWAWLTGNSSSIAESLYRAGYDVWLGNNRGNSFSRAADFVNESEAKDNIGKNLGRRFWNFTIDDLADSDVPAMLDEVYHRTGSRKVVYMGHSMGTSQMLMGATSPDEALRKRITSKVGLFIALSPVAFIEHFKHKIIKQFMCTGIVRNAMLAPHMGFSLSYDDMFTALPWFVKAAVWIKGKPSFSDFVGTGPLETEVPLDEIRSRFPAGTSVLLMNHFTQLQKSGNFTRYDYGMDGNIAKWGTAEVQHVALDQFDIPSALLHAEEDVFVTQVDRERFMGAFPRKSIVFTKTYANYTHGTWMYNASLPHMDDILELISNFSIQQPQAR